jgi:hypothetical protein
VGDRDPIHVNVIIIIEIQEFFSGELNVIVSNDRVRDLKMKNDVLDEVYDLF